MKMTRFLLPALLAGTCLSAPAIAQVESEDPGPVRDFVDSNGVDLMTGEFVTRTPAISIGGEHGLTYYRIIRGGKMQDIFFGKLIQVDTSHFTVTAGGRSEKFTKVSSNYQPDEANGSTLSYDSVTSKYTYTNRLGTVAVFDGSSGLIQTLTEASGRKLTFSYSSGRLRNVQSNSGYLLKLTYYSWPDNPLQKAMLFNQPVDDCSPSATSCTAAGDRPELNISFDSGDRIYTDVLGRSTRFYGSDQIYGIRYPGSSSNDISISYSSGRVSSVTAHGVQTTYSYSDSGSIRTTTVTRGDLASRQYTFDLTKGQLTALQSQGRDYEYSYDSSNRLTEIDGTSGPTTTFTYDSRGNVTQTQVGGITTSATFPSTCTTPACNKPLTTTDGRGKVTDYTYDATHGGLLTVTSPAPTTGATRPQTRYSYSQLNAQGSASSSGTFVLTGTSSCQTQAGQSGSTPAACLGGADEVKSVITFGQNLLPTSVATGAGNDSSPPTITNTYDVLGNLLTLDGPLSGTADTIRYRYDSARQLTGTISADPDGSGSLKHRATKTTYNSGGQVTKVESGVVDSQLDADWSTMVTSEIVDFTYDSDRRKTKQTLSTKSGSTVTLRTVNQFSYNGNGLLECAALRMNPSVFGSLPTSACTASTLSTTYGPDRITRTTYENEGRIQKVQTAVGTSVARDEMTYVYNDAGRVDEVTDGEGNKTEYDYDSLDRLQTTYFPSTTQGAGTHNTSDYEQLSYDGASNVTARRLRDGTTINYTYDNLSRVTLKDLPGTELDVTYAYDNLSRLTSASQTGNALTYSYDALGRLLSEAGPLGTISYAYDLAGRRTSTTYPGSGLAVHYEHLVTGEISKIRENGTSGLALGTYAYDDRGRRASLTRGNGTTTSYAHDAQSRLTQIVHNLGGIDTTKDLTLDFTYSPANQVITNTRSNDAYAWLDHVSVNRGYQNNGLNQVTQSGSTSFTHDARGNLTQSLPSGGTATNYVYDSQNRMVSASGTNCATCSGTATLSYDPNGRLYQTVGSVTTRFAYDGSSLIAEYDGSSTLLRRYVHGPGVDEPLVWYEGSGTSTRKYFHADERGSVIGLSNDAGNSVAVNSYDEYGIPGSTNSGRFQYTGQTYLPELGVYSYKARIYSPTLGRFLQTDPLGYGDGMNMYGYVGGDPINKVDPSGMTEVCWNMDIFIPVSPGTGTGDPDGPEITVSANGHYETIRVCAEIDMPTGNPGYTPDPGAGWHGGSGGGSPEYIMPAPPPPKETAEERRKRLAEAERRRRERNAYCGAIRAEALKDSVLKSLTFGIAGATIDTANNPNRNVNTRNVAKGAFTIGAGAVAVISTIIDVKNATANVPECPQGPLD